MPAPEGNIVALDCEMLVVETPAGSRKAILASVAIVSVIMYVSSIFRTCTVTVYGYGTDHSLFNTKYVA